MKAIWVCNNVKELLKERGEIRGKVHSVFNRASNLITEDDILISLISSKLPNNPRSISLNIPDNKNMHSLGIEKEIEFVMDTESLIFERKCLNINLSQAKIWAPYPTFNFEKFDGANVEKNISCVKAVLLNKGNFDGIGSIFLGISNELGLYKCEIVEIPGNHYSNFIYSKMLKFVSLMMEDDLEGLRSSAKKIIGFGPGLTPSTDDFITGMMLARIYASAYKGMNIANAYDMNQSIVADIFGRTTRVSYEMLQFAAKGQTANHIRSLILAIFSEKDEHKLIQNICAVIETGETSGTDLLAGIYIGFLLILHSGKGVLD